MNIEIIKDQIESLKSDGLSDRNKLYLAFLNRLLELEAAVAIHSFDEFPIGIGRLEYCDSYGAVDCGWFNKKNKKYSSPCTGDQMRTADQMREAGFTGWRYPVGDLSE